MYPITKRTDPNKPLATKKNAITSSLNTPSLPLLNITYVTKTAVYTTDPSATFLSPEPNVPPIDLADINAATITNIVGASTTK